MASAERQAKVAKYEEFVDRRLKPDLVKAVAERDKVFEKLKIYSDLKKNIQKLESNGLAHMRTMVNLGSEVYAQAEVPDTRQIFVDIGLGFHAEFTWSEALDFIEKKEKALSRQADDYTEQIAKIKVQIKLKLISSLSYPCAKNFLNYQRCLNWEPGHHGVSKDNKFAWVKDDASVDSVDRSYCPKQKHDNQSTKVCEGIREILNLPEEASLDNSVLENIRNMHDMYTSPVSRG